MPSSVMLPTSLNDDAVPWTGHPAGTIPPAPPIPPEGVSPPMEPNHLEEPVDAGDLQPPPIKPAARITDVTPKTWLASAVQSSAAIHVTGTGLTGAGRIRFHDSVGGTSQQLWAFFSGPSDTVQDTTLSPLFAENVPYTSVEATLADASGVEIPGSRIPMVVTVT